MRKPKPPRLVTVAVITTVTIILWIFFGVYRILTEKPAVIVPDNLLAPINATLDQQALNSIQGRVYFEEDEIPETPLTTTVIEVTPEETITPTASPAAEIAKEEELSSTPISTESALTP